MKLLCQLALFIFTLVFFMVVPVTNTEAKNNSSNPPSYTDSQRGELPTGAWGGKHISLEVTADGGSVEFDCGHGTIEGKIKPDQQGRFNAKGTYTEEHGGPVRQSDKANNYAVLYTGRIEGEKMKLTIKRSDNKKLVGTFTLARGQEAFLVKCR